MVRYGSDGVCNLVGVIQRRFDKSVLEYYHLKPVGEPKSDIFIPVNNEALTSKLYKVLTADEVIAIIREAPNTDTIWIENDRLRAERYKEVISGSDRTALIQMIRALYSRRQTQQSSKKNLRAPDQQFLKNAEKLLYDEFAYALGIEREMVLQFIFEQIELSDSSDISNLNEE
ncbi:MAG: CarD family transcriptional regulator [Oscillospiraceae bacterium]|jgi:CarD family transcriptional regulator|nr:CarD family transcriptional regulator [Oscillospiraceae bacterium]